MKLIDLGYSSFNSYDYNLLKEIDSYLKDKKDVKFKLIDDYANKDRSYIDISAFEKTSLEIPLTYSFWINNSCDLSLNNVINKENKNPYCQVGLDKLKINEIKK